MNDKIFSPKARRRVLISNDFREVLISHETTIIEQRILVVILSAIKEEQSLFITVKSPIKTKEEKQLSFDDYYDDWANQGTVDFLLSIDDLNPDRKMKNEYIQSALVNMANLNWLRLKDENINGYKAVPFIIAPRWNKKSIYFKMDKAVMRHLLNMRCYFPIKKDLPSLASTSSTLRFLMWLVKYKQYGGTMKSYTQVLKELYISKDYYEGHYRFERDFLNNVKADLDSYNELSFNYTYYKGNYNFSIYYTKNTVGAGEFFSTLNDLQTDRALKYLKKTRQLDNSNLSVLRKLYKIRGYKVLSSRLKRKIDPKFKGIDYVKEVFRLLENE
ncbi:hypothetical protein ASG01_04840 [Chryseobacterium sp. Leaf180]|uniref:RepB family plasmid replication initiator protein n=1 Tax=Chryseobacterium sp. Leaf180 TaxID=1736289 RepID=UPI0006FDDD20|nr:RepB family plasmid replication initiator protein [Chryseobacterium sp. Leaf180]KQR95182.1 hypothetical protein ASG01_04840 [Chryseobacterium sp. Leaf180]